MKDCKQQINHWLTEPMVLFLCQLGLLLGLCLLSSHVHAADTDYLTGTTANATATLAGSGRKWIYLIEGIGALFAFRATKNIYVLGSVIAVAIFIDVLLVMAK